MSSDGRADGNFMAFVFISQMSLKIHNARERLAEIFFTSILPFLLFFFIPYFFVNSVFLLGGVGFLQHTFPLLHLHSNWTGPRWEKARRGEGT